MKKLKEGDIVNLSPQVKQEKFKKMKRNKTVGDKGITVYIASPYTLGDVAVNVKAQLDMVDRLMDLGYLPYAPLYSHFQHLVHPRHYQDWIDIDLVWIEKLDCVLRLKGKSSGADGEVKLAKKLGIPVFYSVEELEKAYADGVFNYEWSILGHEE